MYLALSASYTSYAPALMTRLKAQGFFGGWDTNTGKPKSAQPKVGMLIYAAGATGKRVGQLFVQSLKHAGYPVADTYEYTDVTGSQMSNAVLKFRSDGVTHVFDYTANVTGFMRIADQQGYRPRYALVSTMGPRDQIAGQAPDSQLVGSMGLGFCPVCEVPTAKDPHDSPGARACTADLYKAGLRYEGDPKRTALSIAFTFCDGIKLLAAAFQAGAGFSSTSFLSGLDAAGKGFATAMTFRSGVSRARPAVPAVVRDFAWDAGCACFAYGRGVTPLP
jgi:ABC-type branched-subunit amino acid transport system substrate-binding protein